MPVPCGCCDSLCELLVNHSFHLSVLSSQLANAPMATPPFVCFFFPPPPAIPRAKVCEEKLRYAAYNCVAIDTDMSPWEE